MLFKKFVLLRARILLFIIEYLFFQMKAIQYWTIFPVL